MSAVKVRSISLPFSVNCIFNTYPPLTVKENRKCICISPGFPLSRPLWFFPPAKRPTFSSAFQTLHVLYARAPFRLIQIRLILTGSASCQVPFPLPDDIRYGPSPHHKPACRPFQRESSPHHFSSCSAILPAAISPRFDHVLGHPALRKLQSR